MKPLIFENLWKVEEVAEYLRMSPNTIYDKVHSKTIPFLKIGRLVRFRPNEIEKWLNKQQESQCQFTK